MSNTNKQLISRVIDEIWNKGNYDLIKDFYAEDFQAAQGSPIPARPGRDGVEDTVKALHGGLSEYQEDLEDLIAEGDRVFARVRIRGTHSGTLAGIPPTGKKVDVQEFNTFTVKDGKITEIRGLLDLFTLFQQLEINSTAS